MKIPAAEKGMNVYLDAKRDGDDMPRHTEANTAAQAWLRVKARLKAELGEDVYSSWFMRLDSTAWTGMP